MTTLAQEFGISDRGLAKVCSRHRIPVPPRGYWAKVAAGETPPVPPFLELKDPRMDRVSIRGATSALPESVKRLAHEQRAEREKRVPKIEASDAGLQEVTTSHAVVAKTAKFLRGRKPDKEGVLHAVGLGLCGVVVSQSHAERAIAILDGLARGLEGRGLTVTADDDKMSVRKGVDTIGFTLVERPKRVKYIPTAEEAEREEKRKETEARSWRRRGFDPGYFRNRPPWPEYVSEWTGQLVFAVDLYWAEGLRKTWADGKTQRVEAMLPAIIDGVALIIEALRERREKREEQERQWKVLQHRRQLARARQEREEKRLAHLRKIIELRREAHDIREWLESLPPDAAALAPETDLGRMLQWVEARLSEIDRKTGIEAAASFAGPGLFPEIDDLWDPLGDPDKSMGGG